MAMLFAVSLLLSEMRRALEFNYAKEGATSHTQYRAHYFGSKSRNRKRKCDMLGELTTLLMHYPVSSIIDAFLFVVKGYRLDAVPRVGESRTRWAVAKHVTGYLVGELFMLFVWAIIWLLVKVRRL